MRHVILTTVLALGGACASTSVDRTTTSPGTVEAAAEGQRPAGESPATGGDPALGGNLGEVRFPNSCAVEVQDAFDRAVATFHHMMYANAQQQFEAIAEADPDCAMAYWGIAMTMFHPLWPDTPSREDMARGERAIERAVDLAGTDRERAYIEAARAYYDGWREVGEGPRLQRLEEAMERLHRAHPDDDDGAALYALSMLATAPAADETLEKQRRAAALLRELHEAQPTHPGAIHYGIHAHDFPGLAAEGRDLAHAYHQIAPEVPHALHMPSHIFVRLGDWRPNIEWNIRSGEAALRLSEGDATSLHYVHALDYLMYAYLQLLEDDRARELFEDFARHAPYQDNPIAGYGIAALHARHHLERRDWDSAAQLTADALGDTGLDWDQRPESAAVLAHARGLGAARSGDLESAEAAIGDLERLGSNLEQASEESPAFAYWAQRAKVQRDTVEAWVALARDDDDRAVALMTRAADLEDEAGKNPVMPGFVLPARELLGDLLLELDRPGDALAAYEASLENAPRRANSLYGAGKAAERLGRRAEAVRYYRALIELAPDDAQRPIVAEARRFVDESR